MGYFKWMQNIFITFLKFEINSELGWGIIIEDPTP